MAREYKLNTHINNVRQCQYMAREIQSFRGNGSASANKLTTVLVFTHEATGLSQLKNITKEDYDSIVEQLKERICEAEGGEAAKPLAVETAVGMLSKLNTAIKTMCEINQLPAKDFIKDPSKLDLRRSTDVSDKANNPEATEAWRNHLENRATEGDNFCAGLKHMTELMSAFGLRYREASAIKLDVKDPNALHLNVDRKDMPKCGRFRRIEITTEAQREALRAAKDFARANHMRSLIPADMSLEQCRGRAYREVVKFQEQTGHNYHYHGERHEYAHRKYTTLWEQLSGHAVQCPAVMGLGGRANSSEWLKATQAETGLSRFRIEQLDEKIRLRVSEDLGHGRVDVTLTYLG